MEQAACAWHRKGKKGRAVGTKTRNGEEPLSRGCGTVKILADKKIFLSSREISPIQWESLPSTGTAEDQPCSAVGVCDQTPRALTDRVETSRIYRANPSEHGVSGAAIITEN